MACQQDVGRQGLNLTERSSWRRRSRHTCSQDYREGRCYDSTAITSTQEILDSQLARYREGAQARPGMPVLLTEPDSQIPPPLCKAASRMRDDAPAANLLVEPHSAFMTMNELRLSA